MAPTHIEPSALAPVNVTVHAQQPSPPVQVAVTEGGPSLLRAARDELGSSDLALLPPLDFDFPTTSSPEPDEALAALAALSPPVLSSTVMSAAAAAEPEMSALSPAERSALSPSNLPPTLPSPQVSPPHALSAMAMMIPTLPPPIFDSSAPASTCDSRSSMASLAEIISPNGVNTTAAPHHPSLLGHILTPPPLFNGQAPQHDDLLPADRVEFLI
eukprot:m.124936 g.124936  ORF g.124936 m.124936 type:complete len:215 (+) comp16308_c0_seq5:322-966(+)